MAASLLLIQQILERQRQQTYDIIDRQRRAYESHPGPQIDSRYNGTQWVDKEPEDGPKQ